MNSPHHYIDYASVRQAAEDLIKSNGATTTLEVKNYLRSRGFIAFQAEVSKLMEDVAREMDWEYEWNGRFRIYFSSRQEDSTGQWLAPLFSAN